MKSLDIYMYNVIIYGSFGKNVTKNVYILISMFSFFRLDCNKIINCKSWGSNDGAAVHDRRVHVPPASAASLADVPILQHSCLLTSGHVYSVSQMHQNNFQFITVTWHNLLSCTVLVLNVNGTTCMLTCVTYARLPNNSTTKFWRTASLRSDRD